MAGGDLPPAEEATAAAAAKEEDLIEIVEEGSSRLDIARYVDHVRDLSAGAIATFEGTTRDHFAGRRVVELRYEAYAAMARRRLAGILREARSRHALRRLAVAHRLGPVPAGEASVFVAASATHRADAMEACRYVIDELKASVPIWKKEVYDDGEVWKENREFLDRHSGSGGEGGWLLRQQGQGPGGLTDGRRREWICEILCCTRSISMDFSFQFLLRDTTVYRKADAFKEHEAQETPACIVTMETP